MTSLLNSDFSDQNDFDLSALSDCGSEGELLTVLQRLLEAQGVNSFSLSSKRAGGRAPRVLLNKLPKAVRSVCDGLYSLDRHPLTTIAAQQRLPIAIAVARTHFTDDPLAESWFACIDKQLSDGETVCIPVWSIEKRNYAFLLHIDSARASADDMLILQTICQTCVNELERVRRQVRHQKSDYILTERERECLHLSSLGLTEKRVALSIDISPNTVRVHIENAKRRLGAANKSHAIVLAVLHKEIVLPEMPQLMAQTETAANYIS